MQIDRNGVKKIEQEEDGQRLTNYYINLSILLKEAILYSQSRKSGKCFTNQQESSKKFLSVYMTTYQQSHQRWEKCPKELRLVSQLSSLQSPLSARNQSCFDAVGAVETQWDIFPYKHKNGVLALILIGQHLA